MCVAANVVYWCLEVGVCVRFEHSDTTGLFVRLVITVLCDYHQNMWCQNCVCFSYGVGVCGAKRGVVDGGCS